MENIAIKIENVSKEYRLGAIGGGTLRGDLQTFWAKIRHKEDPNTKIGEAEKGKKGDRFMALDGVSFEVKKGEAVGIIGHNGAGKSTLLKLLCRVTAPSGGKISYNGRIASMLEVGTGFHPELTGRENVYMNGTILGMTKSEIDKKFDEIVKFAEMEKFIDTPVKRYSSGMYVKLAFSVAAHLDSEIMIMDEVLAVGDMAFQKKCLNKMNEAANQEGRTVLYVSHNMNTIRQLCDRCIVLDKGKVVFDGDTEAAIEVYMNKNYDTGVIFNYSQTNHSSYGNRKMEMLGIEIRNKEKNAFYQGEKCYLTLHCACNSSVSDIGFRFEIFYSDGSIVGTVFTDKEVSAKAGQRIDLQLALELNNLAPGSYKAAALAYERDCFGNQSFVDRVDPALFLEIVQSENDDLLWLTQYWGHIKFDDMLIEDIEIVN